MRFFNTIFLQRTFLNTKKTFLTTQTLILKSVHKTTSRLATNNVFVKPQLLVTNNLESSGLLNRTFFFRFLYTNYFNKPFNSSYLYLLTTYFTVLARKILKIYKETLGDGFLYIRGLVFIFFVDACLTDDEPI